MPFRAGEILNYRVAWAIFPKCRRSANERSRAPQSSRLANLAFPRFSPLPESRAHTFRSGRSIRFLHRHHHARKPPIRTVLERNGFAAERSAAPHPRRTIGRGIVAPVLVQPGTRDPLGAFYALRAVDWQRTPEFRVPVYDGSDLYEVRARQEAASEAVTLDAGNFQATKISLRLFEYGKEVPHTGFLVWFAHNPARTPVLMLAEMPVGNVRVELLAAPRLIAAAQERYRNAD